jgi:valyl-tRNA synthetase
LPERWILSRTQRATEEINNALEDFRFSEAAQAVYHFIWDEICDWYIELAKGRLQDPALGQRALEDSRHAGHGARRGHALLHPFMPFITEELWQKLPKPQGAPQSIMITLYPISDPRYADDATEASMALVQKVVTVVRSLRTENNVPSSAAQGDPQRQRRLQEDHSRRLPRHRVRAVALGELVVRRSG